MMLVFSLEKSTCEVEKDHFACKEWYVKEICLLISYIIYLQIKTKNCLFTSYISKTCNWIKCTKYILLVYIYHIGKIAKVHITFVKILSLKSLAPYNNY